MTKKLKSVRQIIEQAEADGKDPDNILVDPTDICELEDSDFDDNADIEQNPKDTEDEEE